MAETTIEWTRGPNGEPGFTFNAWTGCTKVGPGCDGCYAEAWSKRAGPKVGKWGPGAPRVRTTEANWRLPVKWNAQAAAEGRRFRVFCSSLADVFDNEVPVEWRVDLLQLIATTPDLDWLLLTKRVGNSRSLIADAYDWVSLPERFLDYTAMRQMVREWLNGNPPVNIWLGATVVNQAEADRDIPKLLAVPARVRFLSIEPMLGPIDISFAMPWRTTQNGLLNRSIDWVIGGFESGHRARPGNPAWARSLRDQCAAAGTAFLWKQNGEWARGGDLPEHISGSTYCDFDGELKTDDERVWKVGKKAAGRLLDGVEHNGFPEVAQ